jgi:hypothetical protein
MKKMYAFWTCSNNLIIPNPMGFFFVVHLPFVFQMGIVRISDFVFDKFCCLKKKK